MIRASHRRFVLVLASLTFAGCAAYRPSPLSGAHPASADAPVARQSAPSRTLAYSKADTDAVRAASAPRAGHGDHHAPGVAARTVVGEGEVVATTPASGQIVVDHGEIKGFMDPMTMGYRIDPPSLLATVKPGDRIRFTIDVDRRAIVHIEQLK